MRLYTPDSCELLRHGTMFRLLTVVTDALLRYVLGHEAMKLIQDTRVLVCGMRAMGVEIGLLLFTSL